MNAINFDVRLECQECHEIVGRIYGLVEDDRIDYLGTELREAMREHNDDKHPSA